MKHEHARRQLLARIVRGMGAAAPQTLFLLRLRKLDVLEASSGPGAVEHLVTTAMQRLAPFAGPGEEVTDLGGGVLALATQAATASVEDFAHELLGTISRPVPWTCETLYAAANVAACPIDGDAGDAEALLERAMRSLQQAMSRGAGGIDVASEARIESAARDWEMRTRLQEAQQRGELALEYQPVRSLGDMGLVKAEALLRWHSAELGRVDPARFIPMLEASGYIATVGEWVLGQACRDLAGWRRRGAAGMRVAINVSPLQLRGDFVARALRIVSDAGCEPGWIELEITESALIRDFTRIEGDLQAMAAMGFTLAIDDFGAGYSSLGQLAQLPVQHLKMDRTLIEDVPGSARRERVVRAVVALAEGLGLGLTAEGVEREAQAAWLAAFPGMHAQGYHFGRPAAASTLAGLLGCTAAAI